jgi:hypothetical protein
MSDENPNPENPEPNQGQQMTLVIVKSPEDRLLEAQELDRLIQEDEALLAETKASAGTISKRIAEMSLSLRKVLRESPTTPLPLFDEGSGSSTDAPPTDQ